MEARTAGVVVPDTQLARAAAALARDAEADVVLGHSRRVYLFAALQGQALGMTADPELLVVGAMTHDLGLTPRHSGGRPPDLVSADLAAALLRSHGRDEADVRAVSLAIILSALVLRSATTTLPALPDRIAPETALLVAGVEGDLLGRGLDRVRPEAVAAVLAAHPRPAFGRLGTGPDAGRSGTGRPAGGGVPRALLAHLQGCPPASDAGHPSDVENTAGGAVSHRPTPADSDRWTQRARVESSRRCSPISLHPPSWALRSAQPWESSRAERSASRARQARPRVAGALRTWPGNR